MRPYKRANQNDVSDDQDDDGRDRCRDQRKLRTGISVEIPALAKRLNDTADGECVVQNNGAVEVAAKKEENPGCQTNSGQQQHHRRGVERRTVGEVIDAEDERSGHDRNADEHHTRPKGGAENGTKQAQQTTTSEIETTSTWAEALTRMTGSQVGSSWPIKNSPATRAATGIRTRIRLRSTMPYVVKRRSSARRKTARMIRAAPTVPMSTFATTV